MKSFSFCDWLLSLSIMSIKTTVKRSKIYYLRPPFHSSLSQWSPAVVKFWGASAQRMTSSKNFRALWKWFQISLEFSNSFLSLFFNLKCCIWVSFLQFFFVFIFALFLEGRGDIQRSWNFQQHKRKYEVEAKKTNILSSVRYPVCPSTMGTFQGTG